MPKIPTCTGTDIDVERPEIEHFGNCDVCGALVDMRDRRSWRTRTGASRST